MEAGNSNLNVPFHGGSSKYNAAGGVARDSLSANQNWSFTDGGADVNSNYQAVLNFATSEGDTLPNSTIQDLQDDFMVTINPFFSKFKELHLWAGEAGLSGFKSIDFVRLSKADYYNSPSFLANGIKGNGNSSYVDLNFDADAETIIDSLSFGVFAPNGIAAENSLKGIMGASNVSNAGIILALNSSNRVFGSVNSEVATYSSTTINDLITLTSDGSTGTLRQDNTTLGTDTINTQFKASNSVFLLARNYRDAQNPIQFIDDVISLSFIADELTVSELLILSNAIKTYLNGL
jgi:hypothetical protein